MLETRRGFEIGKLDGGIYFRINCPSCLQAHWVRFRNALREGFSGRCAPCLQKSERASDEVISEIRSYYAGNYHRANKRTKQRSDGYVRVRLAPDDFFFPMTKDDGTVLEHRLVMAKFLGRNLHNWEIVHHKNHIRSDNRIENLQLYTDTRHTQLTVLENRIARLKSVIQQLRDENQKLRQELERTVE